MNDRKVTDFLVETANPDALDATLQQMGAALVGGGTAMGYARKDGYYVMRVFGDAGFVRFACEQQGYCRIVRELEGLMSEPEVSDD